MFLRGSILYQTLDKEWLYMSFKQHIDQEFMVSLRRHFHENPELGFQEIETSNTIVKTLTELGIDEILRPTKTSVVGIIKGGKPGKVVALRADIDALPMTEEAEVPYASKKPGIMHSCAHDAHTASLLGAARALMAIKSDIKGTVKLIFQHAEEKPPGGAQELVASGVLSDVEMFFGTHVFLGKPVGTIVSRVGPMLSANDSYFITVQGCGGHSAAPHKSIDPVVIGSEIVINLNLIVSRTIDPLSSVVISCGKFAAGTINNVIPDTARLELSVRTTNAEERKSVGERIRQVVDGICKAHGAGYDIVHEPGYSATINDAAAIDVVKCAAEKYIDNVEYTESTMRMGSEDFSAYSQIAPIAFVGIMAGSPEQGYVFNNHHPKFNIDEGCLSVAATVYVGCALEALNAL